MAIYAESKVVNIYIAEVAMKRKHCPSCETLIDSDNSIVSYGAYFKCTYGRWGYACSECLDDAVHRNIKPGLRWQYKVRSGCSVRWYKEF